jgi:hypothetical protein
MSTTVLREHDGPYYPVFYESRGSQWLSRHRFHDVAQADAAVIVLAEFLGAEVRLAASKRAVILIPKQLRAEWVDGMATSAHCARATMSRSASRLGSKPASIRIPERARR